MFHKVKNQNQKKGHALRGNGAYSSLEDGFLRFIWVLFLSLKIKKHPKVLLEQSPTNFFRILILLCLIRFSFLRRILFLPEKVPWSSEESLLLQNKSQLYLQVRSEAISIH